MILEKSNVGTRDIRGNKKEVGGMKPYTMVKSLTLKYRKALIGIFVFLMYGVLTSFDYCGADNIKDVEIEYGYPDQSIFVATINDKGQPDSPMTLVAKALMTKAGLSWHAMPYPAKRLFDNLKNGTTNFSILVRASSLKDSCLFSRKPIYSTSLNIYYIGDKPPVQSKEDLIGKTVISIRGYSYGGFLKFISDPVNKVVNEVASTHKAAFEMLRDNRADYLIDYASAAGDILSDRPIKGLHSIELSQLDIFLVVSKSHPDAKNLMTRLEEIAGTLNINEILRSRTD